MIEGKVVAILSNTEVIINIGFKDNVTNEMYFAIKSSDGITIKDGDTTLGEFSYTKGYVIAKEVFENFTYCRTETVQRTSNVLAESLDFFNRTVRSRKELDVDPDEVTPPKRDPVVRIGDKVVQI